MNRFLNWFWGIFAILFFIPSFLIMISWQAIPGDSIYKLKTGLEDVVVAVFKGTKYEPAISVKLTQRRYDEATKLLDKKGSTTGYNLMIAEAKQSQALVVQNLDVKQAKALVAQAKKYKEEVNAQKADIKTGVRTIPLASTTTTPTSFNQPSQPAQPTSVQTSTPTYNQPAAQAPTTPPADVPVVVATSTQEVVNNLDDVESQLDDIINEVTQQIPDAASFSGSTENSGDTSPGKSEGHSQGDVNKSDKVEKDKEH